MSTHTFRIRPAHTADATLIADWNTAMALETEGKQLDQAIVRAGVGNGDWWWIQSVYVPPAHRRKGVFSALYRHVEALAKDTPGVIGLRLCVERGNENAQRTYESLGMQDEGYRVFFARTDGRG